MNLFVNYPSLSIFNVVIYKCIYVSNSDSVFICFCLFFCFKYLSIGNDQGILPITYNHLKIIELYQVSFEDMKEILVVLRLITNSPNLQELQISVSYWEHVEVLPSSSFFRSFVLLMDILVFSFTFLLISKGYCQHRDPQTL